MKTRSIRKNSKKRQAILEVLKNTTEHPSAAHIYAVLKPQIPDLSLGTVYRNLGVLCEQGEIIMLGKVDGEERYDYNKASHPHFVCVRCGKVQDFFTDCVETACKDVAEEQLGCDVKSAQLRLSGTCAECLGELGLKSPGAK